MTSTPNLNWDYVIKFVIIGDAAVGKSSILVRLTDERFITNPDPTLGVEFGSKLIHIPEEGKTIKLQCWDTAGTESFRSITRSYYRGAAGALIVFDVTSRASFANARGWLEDVREYADPHLTAILVANKIDLCEEGESSSQSVSPKREVTQEEAQVWAQEEKILFVEASAKTGQNVNDAFYLVCREILTKIKAGDFENSKSTGVKQSKTLDPQRTLELDQQPPSNKWNCCT